MVDPFTITVEISLGAALNTSGLIKRRIDELNKLVSDGLIPPQEDIVAHYTEAMRAINEALPASLVP